MKTKISTLIFSTAMLVFAGSAFANETAIVVHTENNCKYYVSKSGSGFHVMGAINHKAPEKDTKVSGNFGKTGFQDMVIGDSKSPIYIDLVYSKLPNLEEAKKELEFKCMESW